MDRATVAGAARSDPSCAAAMRADALADALSQQKANNAALQQKIAQLRDEAQEREHNSFQEGYEAGRKDALDDEDLAGEELAEQLAACQAKLEAANAEHARALQEVELSVREECRRGLARALEERRVKHETMYNELNGRFKALQRQHAALERSMRLAALSQSKPLTPVNADTARTAYVGGSSRRRRTIAWNAQGPLAAVLEGSDSDSEDSQTDMDTGADADKETTHHVEECARLKEELQGARAELEEALDRAAVAERRLNAELETESLRSAQREQELIGVGEHAISCVEALEAALEQRAAEAQAAQATIAELQAKLAEHESQLMDTCMGVEELKSALEEAQACSQERLLANADLSTQLEIVQVQLEASKAALASGNETLAHEVTSLRREVSMKVEQIDRLTRSVRDLTGVNGELKAQLAAADEERNALRQLRNEDQALLAAHAKASDACNGASMHAQPGTAEMASMHAMQASPVHDAATASNAFDHGMHEPPCLPEHTTVAAADAMLSATPGSAPPMPATQQAPNTDTRNGPCMSIAGDENCHSAMEGVEVAEATLIPTTPSQTAGNEDGIQQPMVTGMDDGCGLGQRGAGTSIMTDNTGAGAPRGVLQAPDESSEECFVRIEDEDDEMLTEEDQPRQDEVKVDQPIQVEEAAPRGARVTRQTASRHGPQQHLLRVASGGVSKAAGKRGTRGRAKLPKTPVSLAAQVLQEPDRFCKPRRNRGRQQTEDQTTEAAPGEGDKETASKPQLRRRALRRVDAICSQLE